MDQTEFFSRLQDNSLPVVVDFWASWCAPCRLITPALKKLGEEYAGQVDVWKIDADEEPALLQALGVYGIPTLIAYRNGKEVTRRTGAASSAVLSTLFEAALSGVTVVRSGPARVDRFLRLAAGVALFILAILGHFSSFYLLLAGLGVIVAFTAVYDRCPIYRLVSRRLKAWLHKDRLDQSPS